MANPFTPYLSFVLGPPADPQFRTHFDETQRAFRSGGDDRTLEETCVLLEPRIPWFVAECEGAPSFLSEAVSLALDSPVEVVQPVLSWGYYKGEYVAQLQIDPRHVRGPEDALDRLFEGGQVLRAIASLLGLLLKLDWVHAFRPISDFEETDDAPAQGGER